MTRVSTKTHGVLPKADTVMIPPHFWATNLAVRLHPAALVGLGHLYAEACGAGFLIKVSSGWRLHRWRDRAHYNATLLTKYRSRLPKGATDKEVIRYGRKWLAYNSPHETGRAIDLRCHGLASVSRTAKKQKGTELYAWLKENAEDSGWQPYRPEPWHWEFPG